jgi:phosphopantetheine adenylyltransferase
MSDADSSALGGHTITVYMPMTETGTYVSDQIVDDIRLTTGLVQTWVPPTVRDRRR